MPTQRCLVCGVMVDLEPQRIVNNDGPRSGADSYINRGFSNEKYSQHVSEL